jgi:hypothetical protein
LPSQRAYTKMPSLVHQMPSLAKCISQMANCWRPIFKIFGKFLECITQMANCWRCSNALLIVLLLCAILALIFRVFFVRYADGPRAHYVYGLPLTRTLTQPRGCYLIASSARPRLSVACVRAGPCSDSELVISVEPQT